MQICKFSSEIKRAWKLRYNQKIEETIAIVSELKMNLGIPSHELDLCSLRDLMRASDAPALFADLILLNASLLRAQRNIDSSRRLITFMEVILREMNLLPHFRLIFEKGITSLIHGNYSQALEEFMGASKISPSVDARGAALINALLCMEDLGFDPTSLYQETRKTLSQLKASEHPGILDQLECFELRQCFRKGNFRALKMAGNEKDHLPYQANYYKRWVNQIPYHRYASANPDPLRLVSKTSAYLYQRSYRIGTLLGTLNPNDKDVTKPTEMVERLYLWTWRWLAHPQSFPVQKIMSILRNPALIKEIHSLSAEDILMVRNSLLWLGLFDSQGATQLDGVLASLKTPNCTLMPLFEFENLVVEYFRSVRDGRSVEANDFRTQLQAHPLWNERDLYLRRLVECFDQSRPSRGPLETLERNLVTILKRDSQNQHNRLIVDVSKFQVSVAGSTKKNFSKPLTLALNLLHAKGVVSCEAFVKICFEDQFFDQSYHQPKIFNLISRLRSIVPENLRLRIKTGHVIAEGSWHGIQFLKNNLISEELRQQPEWLNLTLPTLKPVGASGVLKTMRHSPSENPLADAPHAGPLHRREIESLLKKSRSSTSRIIEQLVQRGFLKKVGKARSTRYFIVDISSFNFKKEIAI